VIAVCVSRKLERQELESLVDRPSLPLARRTGSDHVFAEVDQLSGIDMDGMAGRLRRAVPAHGTALAIIETNNPAVAAFEIDGKLTEAEIRAISAYFNERVGMQEAGMIRTSSEGI
jgi:hypothetical protein